MQCGEINWGPCLILQLEREEHAGPTGAAVGGAGAGAGEGGDQWGEGVAGSCRVPAFCDGGLPQHPGPAGG